MLTARVTWKRIEKEGLDRNKNQNTETKCMTPEQTVFKRIKTSSTGSLSTIKICKKITEESKWSRKDQNTSCENVKLFEIVIV